MTTGGTRPRLPNMDDERFLEAGPELTVEFLTIYMHSARSEPRGTFPEPDALSIILIGDTSLGDYYRNIVDQLKKFRLVGFDADGRWYIPDYPVWNPSWDDPAERMRQMRQRQAEQAGLPIPSKARRPEPLNPVQLARFERVKAAYPKEGWGVTMQAKLAFRKLDPDDEETNDMIAGIGIWRDSLEWIGGHIHHLRTFVSNRMWEDEPETADTKYPRHSNGQAKYRRNSEDERLSRTYATLDEFVRRGKA